VKPIQPRTVNGTFELLPRDQVAFQRMLDQIRNSFERFGFLPIETPVFEYVDVLLTKSGGETEKQIFLAQSSGHQKQGRDADLALRFDNTVPLARYVAAHEGQLQFPFRRYQIQRVYRGERVQRGRYREFYQCDIDVVGKDQLPLEFDAEIPAVIDETFRNLDFGPFTIYLNHRRLLRGMLQGLGLHSAEQHSAVLREVDKLDKRGPDGVREALAQAELGEERAAQLLQWIGVEGDNDAILAALDQVPIDNEEYRQGREELRDVVQHLRALQVAEERFRVAPSIARGLDYYTGTVYETLLDDHPQLGSICSGGRYEDLAGYYTKSRLPGVGISIGATRLFWQLQQLGLTEEGSSTVDVLVTRLDSALTAQYQSIAAELRRGGVNTEVYYAGGKLGKQLKYADRGGCRLAVVVGEDEHDRGTVLLKDLRKGEQEEVQRIDLQSHVRSRLSHD
jgi:histidyl-tRNA synthetase